MENGTEDVETSESWNGFASWVDYESLLPPDDPEERNEAMELMAYVVYNLSACVVNKELLPSSKMWGKIPLRQWLSVDDLVFILGTIENCINKWIRQYRYLEEKKRELVQDGKCSKDTNLLDIKLDRNKTEDMRKDGLKSEHETVKHMAGSKYESGSGIAGAKGQRRLNGLKVYIYKNYFEDTPSAKANEAALNSRLAALAMEDASVDDEEGHNGGEDLSHLDQRLPTAMLDEIDGLAYDCLL